MQQRRQAEGKLTEYVNEAVNQFITETKVLDTAKMLHGPKHADNWKIGGYATKPLILLIEHLAGVLRSDIDRYDFKDIKQLKILTVKLAGELEQISLGPTVLYQVKAAYHISKLITEFSVNINSFSMPVDAAVSKWLKSLYDFVDLPSSYATGEESSNRFYAITGYKYLQHIPLSDAEKQCFKEMLESQGIEEKKDE